LSDQKIQPGTLQGELVKTLYYLTNAVRIHQDNNQLIRECVIRFSAALADFEGEEAVDIQIWRGRFHIQGQRIPYNRESFNILNEMVHYFSERGLGGICFLSSFKDTSPGNIVAFFRMLNESTAHEDPIDWLDQQLDKNSLSGVQILKKQEEGLKNPDMQLKEKAWHTYYNALKSVKEVAEQASKGIAGVRKARRLAQAIVDLVEEDSSLMMGLATIKNYDDYTYTHSLNVALLSTCLGRHLGLSKILLEHLTVCGMFHDLGKVEIPKEILLKPGVLTTDECDMMRKHPLIGVRKILNLQAPQAMRSKIIRAPLEHHLNPDLSGYPKTRFIKKLSLLGKILHIADVYEALTSNRRYRPRAFTHNEALRRMWSERGKNFDTVILKYFIHMIGIYPIGSVVELDSGEIGLVLDYPDESHRALPILAFLVDDGKGGITRGETVNLAAQRQDQGSTQKSIVRSIPSSYLGIQPAKLILQDKAVFGCL
jgi:HD-GYP domain-containing protein (c-di-GMP phosphodiesterase class II)